MRFDVLRQTDGPSGDSGHSRPRVAMLAPYVPYPSFGDACSRKGGVERYVTEIAQHMNGNGYEIVLVTPCDGGNGAHRSSDPSVVHIPRLGMFFSTPVFSPHHLLRCVSDFDIVHTQGTFPILSDFSPLLAKLKRVPSVITYHFDPSPPGACGEVIARLYKLTLAKFIRQHDRFIFATKSYRDNARLFDGIAEDRVRYVPYGVDTDYFVPDTTVPVKDRFLFVGRFVPYKAIPILLKAMALVNKELPNHELCLVGGGPLEKSIREMAKRLGVNARFVGQVSDDQLRSFYRSSIATVLSSHDKQEAYGLVLTESLSCGTPVVAADIPGVREAAMNGGKLVEPKSSESLASAMIEAAESVPSPSEKMRLHSRMESAYSWRTTAKSTASVYDELLA